MLKLEDFFGLAIDEERADLVYLMSILDIEKAINGTKVVSSLSKSSGADAAIVTVARRQQILKLLKPMLNEDMLDYDANFYSKEINTSSDHDRRYGAEEHLLEYCRLVASTKSRKTASEDGSLITIKQLREAVFKGTRFDRCWDLLSKETEHTVSAFRASKK